jgi:hypothetical protein
MRALIRSGDQTGPKQLSLGIPFRTVTLPSAKVGDCDVAFGTGSCLCVGLGVERDSVCRPVKFQATRQRQFLLVRTIDVGDERCCRGVHTQFCALPRG